MWCVGLMCETVVLFGSLRGWYVYVLLGFEVVCAVCVMLCPCAVKTELQNEEVFIYDSNYLYFNWAE